MIQPTLLASGRTRPLLLLAFALLACPAMQAQNLADDIVGSFPPETIQIEFSRLAKLRELPAYASLRERYLGQRLSALEASVSQLGIQEGDIDQIVLAWQPVKEEASPDADTVQPSDADANAGRGMTRNMWPTLLNGLMAGRFELEAIAHSAEVRGIPSTPLEDGLRAYCFQGASASCVVFLNESLAVFGTRESLTEILDARSGRGANLFSSPRLLELLHDAPTRASIWGVAVGPPAVAEWFEGWLPGQEDLKLDWSHTFETVDALRYSVEADERVRLDIKLDCATPEVAMKLSQLFQGLKLIQQIVWQRQNPNRFNPVEALEVKADGSLVSLTVITEYAEIQDYASFPLRHPEK